MSWIYKIYYFVENLQNIINLADTTVTKQPINDNKVKCSQFGQQSVISSEYVFQRCYLANWEDSYFHHFGHVSLTFDNQSKFHE